MADVNAALGKPNATTVTVTEAHDGQRLDNFLLAQLKGVPKSHVYRIIRSGEVRVNSRRAEASQRVVDGDLVRVPPVRQSAPRSRSASSPGSKAVLEHVIFEDAVLLVLNKPAGLAVHGGSGVSLGAIEKLRQARPELKFLELAHRLDRDTSGLLILAKKRSALLRLHEALREGTVDKRYLTLVRGDWRQEKRSVRLALNKYVTEGGERRVEVHSEGMAAETVFRRQQRYGEFTLLEAELKTGRTHQIRVHLASVGFPIAGDDKYGDFTLNKELAKRGLKRMFLHAHRLKLIHPVTGEMLNLEAPLAPDLQVFLPTLTPINAS